MAATAAGTDRPRSVLASEDEFYVLVDLGSDAVTAQELLDAKTCQLVGLDTPTPYLSVAGHVFRGQHQEVVGSQLVFRKDAPPPQAAADGAAPAAAGPAAWPLHAVTSRLIRMEEVTLTPLARPSGSASTDASEQAK